MQTKEYDEFDSNEIWEQEPMNPEWWDDLYTDANGNCYSDADLGL